MPLRCNDEGCPEDATTIFASAKSADSTLDLMAFCPRHTEMYTDEIRRVHAGGVAASVSDAAVMIYRGVHQTLTQGN